VAEIISDFENQEILASSSAKGELIQREISSIVLTDPEFNKGLTITQMSYRCSVIKEKGVSPSPSLRQGNTNYVWTLLRKK
jgi:hypothetical protein